MAEREEVRFRSVPGGFKKADVNKYIKETDLRHAEEMDALGDRLREAEDELASVKANVVRLEEEKAELEKTRDEYKNERLMFENDLTKARNEADRHSLTIAEQEKKIAALEAELAAVRAEKSGTQQSTAEKVHSRLGLMKADASRPSEDIISTARETAQKMIQSAERECEAKRTECEATVAKIRRETEEQALYIREKLSKTAGAFLSNVGSDLNESIESCMREINSCVGDMESEVRTLLSKISTRSEEMNGRIAYYREYLADGMDENLTRIGKTGEGNGKDNG